MITRMVLMISLLMMGASLTPSWAHGAPLARKTTLSNGLTLLVAEKNHLPTIHLQLLLRSGSVFDPPGKPGVADLTAELLPQGSSKRDALQINHLIDGVGGAFFASADSDYSAVNLALLKKDLPLGLSILSEVLLEPAFAPAEIDRKVSELKARLKKREEDPRQVARRFFYRRLFGSHPYALPPEGTDESLSAITREDLLRFFKTFYRPNNATVIVVGRITLEEAARLLEEGLKDWKPGPVPAPPVLPLPDLQAPQIETLDRPISQANIVWGHPGITRANPDFYTLLVMNYILGGGGFVSRLVDQIRDNLGLTYGIRSAFDARRYGGAFTISVETKNQNTSQAMEELGKELKKFLDKGVTETELAEAKAYLTGSFPLRMDSNAKLVTLLGAIDLYDLGLDYPDRYPEWINRVTAEEVLRAARQYLHPENFLLVVLGNQKEIQILHKKQGSKKF
jgi:zinc protease